MYSRACHQESISKVTGHGVPILARSKANEGTQHWCFHPQTCLLAFIQMGSDFAASGTEPLYRKTGPLRDQIRYQENCFACQQPCQIPLWPQCHRWSLLSLLNEHVAKPELTIAQWHCWTQKDDVSIEHWGMSFSDIAGILNQTALTRINITSMTPTGFLARLL